MGSLASLVQICFKCLLCGYFEQWQRKNFKRFHVCMRLYVCVAGRAWRGETVGPLFLLGLAQQQLSSGRHIRLSALQGTLELFLGHRWHNGRSQTACVCHNGQQEQSQHPSCGIGRAAAAVLGNVRTCRGLLCWRYSLFTRYNQGIHLVIANIDWGLQLHTWLIKTAGVKVQM